MTTRAVWNTAYYVLGSIVFQIVLGTVTGILLNQKFPRARARAIDGSHSLGGSRHRRGNHLGVDVPHRVRDHQPHADRGRHRDKPIGWLTGRNTVMPALIAINVWKLFPFVAIMVLAALQTVPEELYESARVDGASFWQEAWHVMIPQIRPVLCRLTLLLLIWGLNAITIIYTITKGGPANRTLIIPIQIFRIAFEAFQLNQAAALSVMFFAFTIVFVIVYICVFARCPRSAAHEACWLFGGWFSRRRGAVRFRMPVPVLVDGVVVDQAAGRALRDAAEVAARETDAGELRERHFRLEHPALLPELDGDLVRLDGDRAAAGGLRLLRLCPLQIPRQGRWRRHSSCSASCCRPRRHHRAAVHHAARLALVNSYLGLILVYTIITLPLSIWMLTSYFRAIPVELEEAAIIDGATRLGVLLRITLPLSLPGIVAIVIYAFVTTWNEFLFALVFAQDYRVKTLPIGIAEFTTEFNTDWGAVMAASVIMTLPIAILFMAMQRMFVGGLTAGAVKG